jgi:hypothetical protein
VNGFFGLFNARALQHYETDFTDYAVVYMKHNEMLRLRKMRTQPIVTGTRIVFADSACGGMMRRTQEGSTLASCQDGK